MKYQLLITLALIALSYQANTEKQFSKIQRTTAGIFTYTPSAGALAGNVGTFAATDEPKGETIRDGSYFKFVQAWAKATDCTDATKLVYKADLSAPSDMQFDFALKNSASCSRVIKTGGTVPAFELVSKASAQLCEAQLTPFKSGTGATKWMTCWTAATGAINLSTAKTVFSLVNVIPFTQWAAKTTSVKEDTLTWTTVGQCVRNRDCWKDEASLDKLPDTIGTVWGEFTDKGPYVDTLYARAYAAIDASGKCKDIAPTDVTADVTDADSQKVYDCFEEAYKHLFYEDDRKAIECLQQCVRPTHFFGYNNPSSEQQPDGEIFSDIDTDRANARLALFTKFKGCMKFNNEFIWYDFNTPFTTQIPDDVYGNGAGGAATQIDQSKRIKQINHVRNCFQSSEECQKIRTFWTGSQMSGNTYYFNSYSTTISGLDSCKKCLNYFTGYSPNLTDGTPEWVPIKDGGDHQDYHNYENRAASEKYMKCFHDLENGWANLIRKQLGTTSSSSIVISTIAAILGLVALLF